MCGSAGQHGDLRVNIVASVGKGGVETTADKGATLGAFVSGTST